MAYKALIDGSNENFLLVIDELNRGNAAAIFGTVFQLLDRESDGWSSYEVDISDMELFGLLEAMHLNPIIQQDGSIDINDGGAKRSYKNYLENKASQLNGNNPNGGRVCNLLKQRRINIPRNLSIIATINTSDESIYYLDSAFKRRWDWQYVSLYSSAKDFGRIAFISNYPEKDSDPMKPLWENYIFGINIFIKSNYQSIRRIEDKQIGLWFIKPVNNTVNLQQVKDKLMFYLWDSVFARDKKPLENLLSAENKPVKLTQYADFLGLTDAFMDKVLEFLDDISF
jgi:5-methylcytosine-specific restriction endonuclease McrBC GTP-binding regulatory subunit McrB